MPAIEDNTDHLKKLTPGTPEYWDEYYRKDRYFRLYRLDYHGNRYNHYGDNLGVVISELSLKWQHSDERDKEAADHWREFCELREYLEREGLFV